MFLDAIKTSLFYSWKLAKNHWLLILSLYGASLSLSVLVHFFFHTSIPSLIISVVLPLYISFVHFVMIVFMMLFLFPYLFQSILNQSNHSVTYLQTSLAKFIKSNIRIWSKQISKALLMSYGLLFLLIIPGVIQFFKYIFVSHTVLFNRDYKDGKIKSALKHSKKLTKGIVSILILLNVVYFSLTYPIHQWLESFQISTLSFLTVVSLGIQSAITIVVSLIAGVFYHQIYLKREARYAAASKPEDHSLEKSYQISASP